VRPDVLRGRACVVTAATGGIGSSIARELAGRGCRLLLTSRSPDRLAALQQELALRSDGACVAYHAADLRDAAAAARLAAAAERVLGPCDVLVNCAGAFLSRPFAECSADDFDDLFALNVRAPMLLSQALVPGMAARGWGRVVNIGSSSAYAGFAGSALYCASKHALLGLSRALHAEYREHGVRVYCISPGSVRTAMGREVPGQDFESFIEPAEVAEYVAFALSFDGALVSEEIRLNRMVMR